MKGTVFQVQFMVWDLTCCHSLLVWNIYCPITVLHVCVMGVCSPFISRPGLASSSLLYATWTYFVMINIVRAVCLLFTSPQYHCSQISHLCLYVREGEIGPWCLFISWKVGQAELIIVFICHPCPQIITKQSSPCVFCGHHVGQHHFLPTFHGLQPATWCCMLFILMSSFFWVLF